MPTDTLRDASGMPGVPSTERHDLHNGEAQAVVPGCNCPYKTDLKLCHKDCLMYKSWLKNNAPVGL